jgi:8-oxo-dGTP pyrophosphatase MutT (NUDIX family)
VIKRNPSIKEKKTLLEGKFLRFMLTTYTDAYGVERQWESFERVNCRGIVVIVPLTDDQKVILTKQFRPPTNAYVIEFPAGLNDKGDTLEEAAKRELLEETGYIAGELLFLTEGPMSSGASGEILTAYLARNLEYKGIGQRDDGEDIELIEVPLEELDQRLSELQAEGNCVDLKIYGLIDLAKKHLASAQ